MASRVVITGLGVISPIGIGVSEFWKSALAGRSGITAIPSLGWFPMSGYRSRVAGQIHNFSPEQYLSTMQASRVDRYAQFALVSSKEALADADLSMANLGQALQCIRSGQADVIIAVGADASITPLVFAGFCSLRALSSEFNDAPERASRPFDRLRDGFVMGEGAATLVVESWAHAKKRKARVYAELVGYAATSEAYHMVIPQEDGREIATTMKIGLDSAGIGPDQVDYINAHATSTTIGDAVETKAVRSLFKNRADKIAISATKSLIGHTLGAAGAIGAVATTLSIHTGQIHPTVNYEEPDPACRLDGITRAVQERKVRYALLNAFGFGSNNATVVFKKFVA
ncbi:MAG: hypothetical protein HZC50_02205 [Nitrospirae bacterium]|nr:hypothetical protein [Nitrospirota bacterium]